MSMTRRLNKILPEGMTLNRACELVAREADKYGEDNPPPARLIRLGRFLHWRWRIGPDGDVGEINFGSDEIGV